MISKPDLITVLLLAFGWLFVVIGLWLASNHVKK